MTFHPDFLGAAIQEGRWWLIPAILLAAALCVVILVGVPPLLKNPFPRIDPASFRDIPGPDRIRRWLQHFVLGSQMALRLAYQIAAPLLVLTGFFFASCAVLNLLAGLEVIALTGYLESVSTAFMGIAGVILLAAGLFLTFSVRAAALGEEAQANFVFWCCMIMGGIMIAGAIFINQYFPPGLGSPPILFFFLLFLGLFCLYKGIQARSKI